MPLGQSVGEFTDTYNALRFGGRTEAAPRPLAFAGSHGTRGKAAGTGACPARHYTTSGPADSVAARAGTRIHSIVIGHARASGAGLTFESARRARKDYVCASHVHHATSPSLEPAPYNVLSRGVSAQPLTISRIPARSPKNTMFRTS